VLQIGDLLFFFADLLIPFGKFLLQLKFSAAVRQKENWKALDFKVAPAALRRLVLRWPVTERRTLTLVTLPGC